MAFQRIKDFIAPVDDDDDDDENDFEEEHEDFEDTAEVETYKESEPKPVSTYEEKHTRVNDIPSNAQMVLFEPRSFEEAEEIARHLKQKRASVVNLHRLQRDFAQRTIDFLTGVVFALDGTIQKIGHNVILCTPKTVTVNGEIKLDNDDE